MGGYQHRKKDPSSRWDKRTNFQNDSVVSYENFQTLDSDRPLTTWEKAELRDYCADNGVDMPDSPNFQDFFRIVGRGPEYWNENKKAFVTPQPGQIL